MQNKNSLKDLKNNYTLFKKLYCKFTNCFKALNTRKTSRETKLQG